MERGDPGIYLTQVGRKSGRLERATRLTQLKEELEVSGLPRECRDDILRAFEEEDRCDTRVFEVRRIPEYEEEEPWTTIYHDFVRTYALR